ncbi:MAG: DNA internalization-related competence protein ComEC/Rec2 [Gammaproteobacteria bacterium]|nr:DNA internalization-related competence protein ComEC/Rec2 [Gammaproteobacteria bacterium]
MALKRGITQGRVMYIQVILFVTGTILLQWQRALPDPRLLWLIPLLLLLFFRYPGVRVAVVLPLGFLWAALDARLDLPSSLPPALYAKDISITGSVVGLPERHSRHLSFRFLIDEIVYEESHHPAPIVVLLNWYNPETTPSAGETWRLKVRLKPAHGFMNPGGFDYEGWLYRQGIRFKGYVRDDGVNQRLGEGGVDSILQRLRQHIRSVIDQQLQQGVTAGLVRALVIGDRSGLSASDWELFRRTGTNHLVAISGLHIGIIAGLTYFLVNFGWRRIPWLVLRFAAPKAAASLALLAGVGYAALADFSIPTQRALIMLGLVSIGIMLQARCHPFRSLMQALLLVVLLDPFAVLSPGFWLSFTAIAVIFLAVTNRTGRVGLFHSWCWIQWIIALGLAPTLLIWQQQVPLVAPLVNMIAVPLFSLVIIPLALAGTMFSLLSPDVGYLPLVTAGWLLDLNSTMLAFASQSPFQLSVAPQQPLYIWGTLLLGTLLLLLPRGLPVRLPGVFLLLPLLSQHQVSLPEEGAFHFTVLDVGQGATVVIQTRNHTLVYDAGPRYSPDFNAGSDILAPYLEWSGITKVDRLMLSNGDSDHRGGLAGLLQKMEVDQVFSGEPSRISEAASALCQAGSSWSWDGVKFTTLHPDGKAQWRGNNASCVLRVENSVGALLITGDIEAQAEQRLIDCCREALAASVVTMPHHGSSTSSSTDFIQAVSADFVLASTGYLNRYGFPRNQVVARWSAIGTQVLDSALTGAVRFIFSPESGIVGPEKYRTQAGRYWTHRPKINQVSR